MDDSNQSNNQEASRPRRAPRKRMDRPQAPSSPSASEQGSFKQTNQVDRYSRPMSHHGARPYASHGSSPSNSNGRRFSNNNQNGNAGAQGANANPPRQPMARNPRLNQGQPVIRRSSGPRPTGSGAPSGAPQESQITRRRFSPRRDNNRGGRDNKHIMVAQIQEEARTNAPQQVVLSSASRKLRIIPLGGAGEVGSKNMTIFEYGEDIVVIDCGIAFAGPDYPGVDALIPDTTYLEQRKANIRGMVITHGHLDHIGSMPYVWPKLQCPIYATPLSGGLIAHSFEEARITNAPITIINPGDKLHFGKISVEMVRLTHSIPDVLGLAIRCPAGLFFYATDWRLEHRPALGKPADWTRIAQLAGEGITALFSDSTNVDREGYTPSEVIIADAMDRIFSDAKGRIIIAQFASNINRVQQVIDSCKKYNRKLALSGRSMNTYINIAMNLGYLSVPEGMLIDLKKIGTVDAHRLVVLSTGSQGEQFSSMTRIASGEHRNVKLDPSDTVVMSASTIPGNEASVSKVLDNLYHEGVNVIHNKLMSDVHVTGHPNREELRMMISMCQPKYFIPIHGDYYHLVEHGKIAVQQGVAADNIIHMENGQVVEFDEKGGRITSERIQLEEIMIDGLGVGDVGPIVIRDRLAMGKEGMVTLFIVANQKTGEMMTSPDIISRGFIYMREAEELMRKLRDEIKRSYTDAQKRLGATNYEEIKQVLRDDIGAFLSQNTGRDPMIIPVITTL